MSAPFFPSLPDNTNKLSVAIGIVLLTVGSIGLYNTKSNVDKSKQKIVTLDSEIERIDLQSFFLDRQLVNNGQKIAAKYHIPPPFIIKDSIATIDTSIVLSLADELKVEVLSQHFIYYDSLTKLKMKLIDAKLSLNKQKVEIQSTNTTLKLSTGLCIIGLIVFLVGVISWILEEGFRNRLHYLDQVYNHAVRPIVHSTCQSCGLSFNSMIHRGKDADGAVNYSFCSDCYLNGEFTDPDITIKDMAKKTYARIITKQNKTTYIDKTLKNLAKKERWWYK